VEVWGELKSGQGDLPKEDEGWKVLSTNVKVVTVSFARATCLGLLQWKLSLLTADGGLGTRSKMAACL
jgi:hypothetical protein